MNKNSIILVLVSCLIFKCSSPSGTNEKRMEDSVTYMNDKGKSDLNSILSTFTSADGLSFSDENIGEMASYMKGEQQLVKTAINEIFRDKIKDSYYGCYPGEKLKTQQGVDLYTLYAVKDIANRNVVVYAFTFSNEKSEVIDLLKIAYYEENAEESTVEEGCIYCKSNEIQAGSVTYTISDEGKFEKIVHNMKNRVSPYIQKGCFFHASPASGVEGDIYRFYAGDTVKVEYYEQTKGYSILKGHYEWKDNSTLSVEWTEGWKDLDYTSGGILNKPIDEDLILAPTEDDDDKAPTININGRKYWINCEE